MRYQALADFAVNYPHPLRLAKGEQVKVAQRDRMWPEWIWTTNANGLSGWVHESQLTIEGNVAHAAEASNAQEISLRKGDIIESLRELGGWHWCRKADGQEGWTPGYNLRALEPEPDQSPSPKP